MRKCEEISREILRYSMDLGTCSDIIEQQLNSDVKTFSFPVDTLAQKPKTENFSLSEML